MRIKTIPFINIISYCLALTFMLITGSVKAQLNTNGSFESSAVATVSGTDIEGWVIELGGTADAVFEIVDDTVQQGSKALKVTVNATGSNQWDIQAVADSIPVEQDATYNYSIWARAAKPGAQVNFTVGNYSYSEYGAIRPANITTEWNEYTIRFTVTDNQSFIRAPIHFNYATNADNIIYIDNLRIANINAGKTPVIVEAESGKIGSNFSIQQDGDFTYVTTNKDYKGLTSPEDTSSMITYQVTFEDSGLYNLFARLYVGSLGFDDDSFFYGRGFGEKSDTASADWVFINGLAAAGFSNPSDYVDDPGVNGSQIWKWVNITKNAYQGDASKVSFYVSVDSLSKTFQIASREDGLYIDKVAFGKSNLYFTVDALDNELLGSPTLEPPDSSKYYQGPPLAEGADKFLGNAYDLTDNSFTKYWNQLTPGNAGKWGSVATSADTTQWKWSKLDEAYNLAKENGLSFKEHCLIWGQQQPSWIDTLDAAQQLDYIETWFRQVGERYPDIDMVDVVNEPLVGHAPPDGLDGRANYKNALGGNGATGWDWVINSFILARKYLPNAKLLINDYSIINSTSATDSYVTIINLLKDRGLIDGIGVQGHRGSLEYANTITLKVNLDKLAATGVPIYISELDLGNLNNYGTPDDDKQLELYQKIFPVLWEHPGVKGITLWGYIEGQMWQTTCFLVRYDYTWRPALHWLAQYIEDDLNGIGETVYALPFDFNLEQNYPNPFNPSTEIRYQISDLTHVTLRVYDILGRLVETLVDGKQNAGYYKATFNASNLTSGLYFYELKTAQKRSVKKMMVLK